ncbi:hypothetical protein HOLleu_26766 [Holothuria leucospilota]|uniref:Uncharacterized protein n=1 Tax=Holothuria leucospilota TaxID=206669 RepID=A0A9Q1BPC8_HOLLE|nr:hypothetical protein HOLleu_26766 [Holothuria leucospilota]
MAGEQRRRYKRYLDDPEAERGHGEFLHEDNDAAANGVQRIVGDEIVSDVEDVFHYFSEGDEDNAANNNLEQDVANEDHQDGEDLVYPDAPITRSQSALAVTAFALRHSMSKVAVQDLLRLINIHLPEGSLPESVYLFNRNFEECKKSINFHVFCKDCLSYLGLTEELYCAICHIHYSKKTVISEGCYFAYTSLRSQLKALMESASLSHYFVEEDDSRDVT